MEKVTPSKFPYWEGHVLPGDKYTIAQMKAMAADAKKTGRAAGHYDVRMSKPRKILSEGDDIITYPCPLLATTKTGRLVITPSGEKQWIDRTGLNK